MPKTGPNTRRGEKPPIMPLEATQHTTDGAKAFAEFFVKTIDWGYATTSSAYLNHYSAPACQGCRDFASGFDAARRARHHYIGGRITPVSTSLTPKALDKGAQYTSIVTFNIESIEEVTAKGKYVNADEPHSGEKIEVSLRWNESQWSAIELGVDQ